MEGDRSNHLGKGLRSGWTLKHGQEHSRQRERSRLVWIQSSPGVGGEAAQMGSSDPEGSPGAGSILKVRETETGGWNRTTY